MRILLLSLWAAIAVHELSASIARADEVAPSQSKVAPLESKVANENTAYEQVRDFPKSSKFYGPSTPVGSVVVDLTGGDEGFCTGTVISKDMVLTSRHCLFDEETSKRKPVRSIAFWLGDSRFDGGAPILLSADPIYKGDGVDDFLVLRTAQSIDLSNITIPLLGQDPTDLQPLYIYHDPYYQRLTLTRRKCWAVADPKEKVILKHKCETDGGSSGAPIMNEDFEIVGIHRAGGLSAQEDSFNQGILISEIISKSRVVRLALEEAAVGSRPNGQPGATPTPISVTYVSDNGDQFLLVVDTWYLVPKGSDSSQRIRLKQQKSEDNVYLFLAPGDVLYEVPVRGGIERSRVGQEPQWKVIGNIIRR